MRIRLQRLMTWLCFLLFCGLLFCLQEGTPAFALSVRANASKISPQQLTNTTCLQPPQNTDLMTLTDTELITYGLPTHSIIDKEPAQWSYLLAHAKHRNCGSYPDPQKKTHHAIVKQQPDTPCDGCGYSYNNWAGNIAHGARGTYRLAEGDFNVPNISNTSSPFHSHVSVWAGVGGDYITTNPTVLVQAGVDSEKTCVEYCQYNVSWWEVWPYLPEQNLPLSRLNTGDHIHVLITSNNNNDGQDYFYIQNVSANSYNSHTETLSKYFSDSATGECIVERPANFSTGQLYLLADFNTEQVTSCAIGAENNGIDSVGDWPHHYGYITNSGGATLAYPGPLTNYNYDFPVYWKASS